MLIKRIFVILSLSLLTALSLARSAGAAKPDPMRLLAFPRTGTWALQERARGGFITLLDGARVQAIRADGSAVAWTSMRRSADGHTLVLEAPDLTVKILAQWLEPARLPSTAAFLPMAYAKRPGLQLKSFSLAAGGLLPTLTGDVVALENGLQSWDRTVVRPLTPGTEITSWWLTAAHAPARSFLAGYLSSVLGTNSVHLGRAPDGRISMVDLSDFRRLDVPVSTAGTPLDVLYLSWGKSPSNMLAEYAAGARVFTNVMDPAPAFTPLPVPEGWCSWYSFYGKVSEDDVLANTDAARRLFGTRDLRYVQVDDGFQPFVGDWETNERFPHGHRWLTSFIHARGYKAGLWIAPFDVTEKSAMYREHRDWLLRRSDGSLVQRGNNPRWGGAVYVLDPSLPAVRAYLTDLFRRATKEWGYDYLKIDFLFHVLDENAVSAGPMTPVQAYRAALRAIRQGAGPQAYILGCGAPIGPSIGLVNGSRIGPDVQTNWRGVVNAALTVANRQWMHNVWWQNDPDALVLGNPLTPDQARAWTALVGLSGGFVMLTDNLPALAPDRLALAHMALPVSANGSAAPFGPKPAAAARATGMRLADMWASRPMEGESAEPPSIAYLPASVSPAKITVAALFNWTDRPRSISIAPADLGVAPRGRRVHVWDIWNARYLGTVTGSFPVDEPATASRLFAFSPDTGHPQLLGTDAHVTSGARDVLGVSWDTRFRALKGRSRVMPGQPFHVAVSVPATYAFSRMDVRGGRVVREESAPGSVLVRIEPLSPDVTWIARYTGGPAVAKPAPKPAPKTRRHRRR